jgi:hypothetical protein
MNQPGPAGALSIQWTPLLPEWALWVCGIAALAVFGLYVVRGGRAPAWRGLALLGLLTALAGPGLVREERQPLPDVVALIVDRSESMRLAGRQAGAEAALAALQARLSAIAGLDVRVGAMGDGPDGTRLSAALDAALADAPPDRVAGALVVTDGRLVDAEDARRPFPLHQALIGAPDERDRKLTLLAAPRTGPVGGTATISLRVDDPRAPPGTRARLRVWAGESDARTLEVEIGRTVALEIALDRRGPAPVGVEVDAAPGEVSTANNALALTVTGVRDRLRVMLVTGEPYAGARAWRNLLKSDASVDLVQFTILRPPEKQDFTPIEELSLIPFPVRELFLEKIEGFDLVVFDRFKRLVVLPDEYLESVARWVEDGGAFLMLAGPAESLAEGAYSTPLARVIPARPLGRAVEAPFRPTLTERGRGHPISAPLAGQADEWGRWLRVQASEARGDVLLEGAGQPLLVVGQVGRGRAAAVMSDQAWLWQRGHEGGGPFNELFRRTAHWLMKEPDLEDDRLTLRASARTIVIERRSASDPGPAVVSSGDGGEAVEVALTPVAPGLWRGETAVGRAGLHRVRAGERSGFVIAGVGNPAEARELTVDGQALSVANRAVGGGGGGVAHLGRDGAGAPPELRRVGVAQAAAGADWWGLRRTDAHTVVATRREPLAPAWVLAFALLGLSLLAWWREGR